MFGKSNRPHLLIMKLSTMGEVAMTVPAVEALRRTDPDVRITVMMRHDWQPFFRDIAGVEFFVPDFEGRHRGLAGIVRLYHDLVSTGVTHVADLEDSRRTRPVRRLLKMKGLAVSVVDRGMNEKRALTRKFRKILTPLKPTMERYREAVAAAGFDPVPLPRRPARRRRALPDEVRYIRDKEEVWIGLAPFSGHRGKIYPAALTERLAGLLAEKYDRVFIFGRGPYERAFAEHLAGKFRNITPIVEFLTLTEEMDLMSNLDGMVSMDSSAMHMASLTGATVVSLWGATHPAAGSYGWGQDLSNAVQLDLDCRPCSLTGDRRCMWGDYRCLSAIDPADVVDRVERALSKRKKRAMSEK